MKSLITIILMLINLSAIACHCSVIPEFKNKNDLRPYDFIALAEVLALSPPDAAKGWLRRDGNIKIKIIELFKGQQETVINEPDVNSSCDMGINLGEQWLFFGSKVKDKVDIGSCNYNVKYRDTNGLRDWRFFRGIDRLNVLRDLFNPGQLNSLIDTVRYNNGHPEIVQHFKDGRLQGERQIFYPTGQVYVREKFKNGQRTKYRKVYAITGQLIYDVKYSGQYARMRVSYYDTLELKKWLPMDARFNKLTGEIYKADDPKVKIVLDSLSRVPAAIKSVKNYKTEFSHDGRSYKSYTYSQNEKIVGYSNVDSRNKIAEYYRYYESGSIQTYQKLDAANNQEIEHDYQSDGARRDFLNSCESCKYYFDPKYDNGSKPEAIYLW